MSISIKGVPNIRDRSIIIDYPLPLNDCDRIEGDIALNLTNDITWDLTPMSYEIDYQDGQWMQRDRFGVLPWSPMAIDTAPTQLVWQNNKLYSNHTIG